MQTIFAGEEPGYILRLRGARVCVQLLPCGARRRYALSELRVIDGFHVALGGVQLLIFCQGGTVFSQEFDFLAVEDGALEEYRLRFSTRRPNLLVFESRQRTVYCDLSRGELIAAQYGRLELRTKVGVQTETLAFQLVEPPNACCFACNWANAADTYYGARRRDSGGGSEDRCIDSNTYKNDNCSESKAGLADSADGPVTIAGRLRNFQLLQPQRSIKITTLPSEMILTEQSPESSVSDDFAAEAQKVEQLFELVRRQQKESKELLDPSEGPVGATSNELANELVQPGQWHNIDPVLDTAPQQAAVLQPQQILPERQDSTDSLMQQRQVVRISDYLKELGAGQQDDVAQQNGSHTGEHVFRAARPQSGQPDPAKEQHQDHIGSSDSSYSQLSGGQAEGPGAQASPYAAEAKDEQSNNNFLDFKFNSEQSQSNEQNEMGRNPKIKRQQSGSREVDAVKEKATAATVQSEDDNPSVSSEASKRKKSVFKCLFVQPPGPVSRATFKMHGHTLLVQLLDRQKLQFKIVKIHFQIKEMGKTGKKFQAVIDKLQTDCILKKNIKAQYKVDDIETFSEALYVEAKQEWLVLLIREKELQQIKAQQAGKRKSAGKAKK